MIFPVIPLPYKIGAIILFITLTFFAGLYKGKSMAELAQANQVVKDAKQEVIKDEKSDAIDIKTVIEYKDRVVTVEKEIPVIRREVREIYKNSPNPACTVNPDIIRLHNNRVTSHNNAGAASPAP